MRQSIDPIDKRYVQLKNVNYFVLQGALDADVSVFYGQRQYDRISWDQGEQYFKSALYVQGANHGQFNTSWGESDISAPANILINQKDMLLGEQQREIAKLFISAFLEKTLFGIDNYDSLFTDYSVAAQWLPKTTYIQRYESNSFMPIVRYEEDEDTTTTKIVDVKIDGLGFVTWDEVWLKDREGNSLRNQAVHLSWNRNSEAYYELDLNDWEARGQYLNKEGWLSFELANADLEKAYDNESLPQIWIEFVLSSGKVIRKPFTLPPVIQSRFTKAVLFEKWLKKGKIEQSAEVALHTFHVSVADLLSGHTMDTSSLSKIRFVFPYDSEGEIYLDNIGWYATKP